MSIVTPGTWDEQAGIVHSPVFATRAPRRLPSAAHRIFSAAIYAAEQADRAGHAITVESMATFNPELPKKVLADLLTTTKFQVALEERGLALPSASGLSPEQLAAAAIYLDMTTPMSHAQKLKAAGITDAKWRGWLRQPKFAQLVSQVSEEALRAAEPVALQRLSQLVDDSNLKAIEMVLEITGRHDRRKETVDVNQLLLAIFTVLDDEISPLPGGVDVLNKINTRVRAMMGGGQAAPVMQISPTGPDIEG